LKEFPVDAFARVVAQNENYIPAPKQRERKLEVAVHELRQVNEILFGAIENLENTCARMLGNMPQPTFDGEKNGNASEPCCQIDMLRAVIQQSKQRALRAQHFASVLDEL
jgi:hypothetical protein